MSVKELLGLENLLLNKELTVEEYFGIVVSSTELTRAKTTVGNVITRLKTSNDVTINVDVLQNLYEDFFQVKIDQKQLQNPIKSDQNRLSNPSGSQDSTNDDDQNTTVPNKKKKNKKKKKGNNRSDEPAPVILWFRRDLRLYDNPALVKAAYDDNGNERPVIPVFIWNEKEENERMNNGGAVKVWLNR